MDYIATAPITSRLDYRSSILYNITSNDILNLQCVQNCLSRDVTRSSRFSHSVPLLESLRWLTVQSRIIFNCAPVPIKLFPVENIQIYFPCFLQHPSPESSVHLVFTCCLFPEVKFMLELVFFSFAIPTLQNSLPEYVKLSNSIVSCHHRLKPPPFRLAYRS